MDSDKPSSTSRKHKFTPKPPSRRKTKTATASKIEKADDNDDAEVRQQLLQDFNELGNLRHQRPKVEDKVPVQATFIHGGEQTVSIRKSDYPQDVGLKHNTESDLMDLDDSTEPSKDSSGDDSNEYREPWNCTNTYYPTTLPWRRPYSGDPDILDEAEFGEAAMKLEFDENKISPASELGFLNPDDTSEDIRLLFLQLPPSLPALKRSATAKGKQIEVSSGTFDHKVPSAMGMGEKGFNPAGTSQRSCSLEELPAGQIGKLLVYKSGAVKLKLGETLYDVSAGSDCSFAQEVVAINTKKKEFCSLGNLDKRAIITPDTENLLDSLINLG